MDDNTNEDALEGREREKIAQSLRESEERYRSLINNVNIGVYRNTSQQGGRFLQINPALVEMFGYESETEFLKVRVADLYEDPEDRERFVQEVNRLGHVRNREIRLRRRDGTLFWGAVTTRATRDAEGGILWMDGVIEDITERKQSKAALQRSEEKYRLLFESAGDAIFIHSLKGRMLAVNSIACKQFGYTLEEMMALGPDRIDVPEEASLVPERTAALQNEGRIVFETVHRRKDGTRLPTEVNAQLVSFNGEPAVMAICRDITGRKQLEESLLQAKLVAENSARTRSEFVANMSHEIRTPMNGIMGMLNLLTHTQLAPEQKEYLEVARNAAASLLSIINDILDFSKIEAKKLEFEVIEFGVASVCEDILPLMGFEANQKGLEVVCDIDAEMPERLIGDPIRLKQVLLNLLRNAVKFTDKGHVLLKVELFGESKDGVCELHFSVTDTGVGVPEEMRQVIFDSFTQADSSMSRKYGGTGLGLTISKSLVEMMGGAIWVESVVGQGSTFHFIVPFRMGEHRTSILKRKLPELKGLRTLVVDDNDVNRRILGQYLKSWGMTVLEAEDGDACLRRVHEVETRGEPCNLILLDCMMPGLSGFDVATKLMHQDKFQNPIIIMLSSMDEQGGKERCKALGIAQYLVKPVSPSTLYNAIISVVGLPAYEEDAEPRIRVAEEEEIPLPEAAEILVAEDNPLNVEVVRGLLERVGLTCDVVGNGRQALEALARKTYDVVLLDIQMPEMDGIEATLKIREAEKLTGRHVPIVAVTAHSMKGDRARFLSVGMDDYLAKPFDERSLYQMISRYAKRPLPGPDARSEVAPAVSPRNDLPLLDPQDLLDRMGQGRDLVVKVLNMFLGEMVKGLTGIEEALESREPKKVEHAAHYFKSMSGSVSAKALREACFELEKLGVAGELDAARERLPELRELVRKTDLDIRSYLGRQGL